MPSANNRRVIDNRYHDDFEEESQSRARKRSNSKTKKPIPKKQTKKVVPKQQKVVKKAIAITKKKTAAPKAVASKKTGKTLDPAILLSQSNVSEDFLRSMTEKERRKFVKKCQRIVNQDKKEQKAAKFKKLPLWQQADALMTNAGSVLARVKGLGKADLTKPDRRHLPEAVGPLRKTGERDFARAMEIVAGLSATDAAKFWDRQSRNLGVTCFDKLVTKKSVEPTKQPAAAPAAEAPAAEAMTVEQPAEAAQQAPAEPEIAAPAQEQEVQAEPAQVEEQPTAEVAAEETSAMEQ
jgi:hypothetical protein